MSLYGHGDDCERRDELINKYKSLYGEQNEEYKKYKTADPKVFDNFEKIYGHFKNCAQHENDLVNQRVRWYISIMAIMYTGIGYIIIKYFDVYQSIFDSARCSGANEAFSGFVFVRLAVLVFLYISIYSIGFVYTRSAYVSVSSACEAIYFLKAVWFSSFRDDAIRYGLPLFWGGGSFSATQGGHLFALDLVLWGRRVWLGGNALGVGILIWSLVCRVDFGCGGYCPSP